MRWRWLLGLNAHGQLLSMDHWQSRISLQHTSGIEFIVCDKRAKNARTELQRALKHREFDVLLQMQIAFRANWLGSVVRAKRRVGFDKARSKELHSGLSMNAFKVIQECMCWTVLCNLPTR